MSAADPLPRLLDRLVAGDEAVWEALFERLLPSALAAVRGARAPGGGGHSEDAVASAAKTLFRRVRAGLVTDIKDETHFAAYFVRIALNKAASRWRRDKRLVREADLREGTVPDLPGPVPDAESRLLEAETLEALGRGMAKVRADLLARDAAHLAIFEARLAGNETNREIAARLGLSERTTGRVWANALSDLRAALDAQEG